MTLPRTSEIANLIFDYTNIPKAVKVKAFRQGRIVHEWIEKINER